MVNLIFCSRFLSGVCVHLQFGLFLFLCYTSCQVFVYVCRCGCSNFTVIQIFRYLYMFAGVAILITPEHKFCQVLLMTCICYYLYSFMIQVVVRCLFIPVTLQYKFVSGICAYY